MVGKGISDDRDAFRRLFEAHREAVFRLLYRLAGDRHDAEDLLQETFARLWDRRGQFQGNGSLEGYLRRIAFRVYLNARPRLRRVRAPLPLAAEPADDRAGPAERASREDLQRFLLAHVRRVVDELPDSWREPFLLFRYEGLKCREIADVLGLTPKAVELRVTRALQRVAARLEDLRARYGAKP